jgi:hypothetical protein
VFLYVAISCGVNPTSCCCIEVILPFSVLGIQAVYMIICFFGGGVSQSPLSSVISMIYPWSYVSAGYYFNKNKNYMHKQ